MHTSFTRAALHGRASRDRFEPRTPLAIIRRVLSDTGVKYVYSSWTCMLRPDKHRLYGVPGIGGSRPLSVHACL